MTDLVAFLTGVWDEDEAVALASIPEWADAEWMARSAWEPDERYSDGARNDAVAVDPRRRLADIASKRAIVALHPDMLGWCQGCASETYPCRTVVALAQPYADRPGFDEAWLTT